MTTDSAVLPLSDREPAGPPAGAEAALGPAKSSRFLGIESLRGLAALAIVAQHARGSSLSSGRIGLYMSELTYGVAVFFVISGFVLYRPHASRRLQGRGPVDVGRFARRRVARIVPAYLVMLLAAAVIVPGDTWLSTGGWRYLVFGQSFTSALHQQSIDVGIGQTWSVAIEVWFYVGLALLFLLWAVRRPTARLEFAVLGTALAATVLLLLPSFARSGVLGNLWLPSLAAFLCGMLMAVAHVQDAPWLRRIGARPSWLAAVAVLTLVVGGLRPSWFLLAGVVFATAVVLMGINANSGSRTRVLLDSRLIALGTISYGVYLWHEPLLFSLRGGAESVHGASAIVRTLLALALTGVLATLSWHYLERPILRRTR